jgi:hypothetical protein
MIGTSANEEHTKEESRTFVSDFKVITFLYDECVHRLFCLIVIFLFENKLKNRRGINGQENKKIKRRYLS